MRYRLAIFDMDGTILDTLRDMTDSLNHVMREYGLPEHTPEEVRLFVGNGIHKLIERAVPEGTREETLEKVFNSYVSYYEKHCADATRPYDGITRMLEELRKKGVLTAVVSNKKDVAVQALVKKYFDGLFDESVGEREGIRIKPAPDSVLQVLKELGIEKDDAVYIGDSDVDLNTALNAGLDAVAVTWGFRDREFLKKHGATFFADDPGELCLYIAGN
ncbi:MAG: HAD family hydrolase [Lachnospiraceae bacterium]|nr:HAD family hydrolase [Lachnospiraceae bacterium]